MRRTFLTLIAMAAIMAMPSMVSAESVSQKKAQDIAAQFFAAHTPAGAKSANAIVGKLSLAEVKSMTSDADPSYYIFNAEGQPGYVIVSGEDKLPSLLGYSLDGSWPADENSVPTPLKNVLDNYAAYVQNLREGKVQAPDKHTTSTSAQVVVAPLLTTNWSQTYPYNKYAPAIPDSIVNYLYAGHFPIGCTAVALSQILNYWGQKTGKPVSPKNRDTYAIYCNYYNASGELTEDTIFYSLSEATKYDYEHMPDSIGLRADTMNVMSEEDWQRGSEAIGKLMGDVAYSLNMVWYPGGSGGSSELGVPDILDTCFGFSLDAASVYTYEEGGLTKSEYVEKIKDNLDKGYPVLAGGFAMNVGGHAFVFDGYDTNGFVHVNWGWGGIGNSFVDLAYLNVYYPKKKEDIFFKYMETMVYNIHPKEEGAVETPCLNNDNVQLLRVGYEIGEDEESSAVFYMEHKKVGDFTPVTYLDRGSDRLNKYYQAVSCHKSFGYDYDIVAGRKCLETGVTVSDTIHNTTFKDYGRAVADCIILNEEDVDVTQIPDGTYTFFGAVREVLNGETSEWKPLELKADTIIFKGDHIILNTANYNKLYHADNCCHYIQDAGNKVYFHMEYDKDPQNIHPGDELNMILEIQGIMTSDLKMNADAKGEICLVEYSDDKQQPDTLIKAEEFDDLLKSITEAYAEGEGCMPYPYLATRTYTEADAGKTFHYVFTFPGLGKGITLSNDITVHSATGIEEVQGSKSKNDRSAYCYNLQGQRISNPVKGQIYITGGRKVLKR